MAEKRLSLTTYMELTMDCEYCGQCVDDTDWGDVKGAIVCYDCLPEAIRDQGLQDQPEWKELLVSLETDK
jgi:hypothetical protein